MISRSPGTIFGGQPKQMEVSSTKDGESWKENGQVEGNYQSSKFVLLTKNGNCTAEVIPSDSDPSYNFIFKLLISLMIESH